MLVEITQNVKNHSELFPRKNKLTVHCNYIVSTDLSTLFNESAIVGSVLRDNIYSVIKCFWEFYVRYGVVHLIVIRDWPKNLNNFLPGTFYLTPHSLPPPPLQLGTKEYLHILVVLNADMCNFYSE